MTLPGSSMPTSRWIVLVDSHVLLWIVSGDDRLGPDARRRLRSSQGVHVSAITVLELTIKKMLGRLDLPDDLTALLEQQGLRHAAFEAQDAALLERYPALVRHDPFDRALLAQATRHDWAFMTADERLLGLGLDRVIDARV